MNRFLARTGSAVVAGWLLTVTPVLAADEAGAKPQPLWFQGARLIFAHAAPNAGDLAVASDDPGFLRFLDRLGARFTYQPGQRYVILTTADRRIVTFTVDDDHYVAAGLPDRAPFPVRANGNSVILPFYTVARALDVEPVSGNGEIVLQPQITGLQTHVEQGRTIVAIHAALVLAPQIVNKSATVSTVRFAGVASTLESHRLVETPGLSRIDVAVGGPPRNPTTTITFVASAAGHGPTLLASAPNDANFAFGVTSSPSQPSLPLADGTRAPVDTSASPAVPDQPDVTDLHESSTATAYVVRLGITGSPTYTWRTLGDGRFYIDIAGAKLALPRADQPIDDPRVSALRLRENGTPGAANVRLALTLVDNPGVGIASDPNSLTITVGGPRLAVGQRSGSGRIGVQSVVENPAAPPPVQAPSWADHFAPLPARGGNVIVLDPGHGGSDTGAVHNGLVEKDLTLDISRRLREILVARGWTVRMTRDSDVDVFAANDSAHDELQARCDVANNAGARLFVSIHINSFTSSDLNGTTTYFYKPADAAFANVVEQKLIALLGTANDGARRENFYVVRHTTMPAILVETAFLSNADDARRLRSPQFRQLVAEAIGAGIGAYVKPGNAPAPAQGPMTDTNVPPPTSDDLSQ